MTEDIKILDSQIASIRRKIAKYEVMDLDSSDLKSDYYELLSLRDNLKAQLRAKGYKLTTTAIRKLKDMKLKLAVANSMGVNIPAVDKSIKTGGKSIAEHYDAVNTLHDLTGLLIDDIRKPL